MDPEIGRVMRVRLSSSAHGSIDSGGELDRADKTDWCAGVVEQARASARFE
jgi:hypothetical protein